eukprot:54874_1
MAFIPKSIRKNITFISKLHTIPFRSYSLANANANAIRTDKYDNITAQIISPTLPFFASPYMHSTNNEDYLSELTILKHLYSIKKEKLNLLSICGGGDTITSLLNYNNIINKIDAVDMNESQLHLLDLKIKSMITFKERNNTLKLLLSRYDCVEDGIDRIGLYDMIRGHLNCNSRNFWDLRRNLDINYGIIGCSIYDRLLKLMIYGLSINEYNSGKFNNISQLSRSIEQSINTYLSNEYLPILFNNKMRPRAFVNVERIAKNHKSLIENFYRIHKDNIFTNYFFSLIMNLDFTGNINQGQEDGFPLWLQRETYSELRSKYANSYYVDKILSFNVGDVSEIGYNIACNLGEYKYDYINLSNAMEWMDVDYYHHIINILQQTLSTNGIIFHRFHLIGDDNIMKQQIILWNKALNDNGNFNVIENNNTFKLNVLKNERSKFGFHPDCISIAIKKIINY